MKILDSALGQSLDVVLKRYVDHVELTQQQLPKIEFDINWRSPCEIGEVDSNGFISWRPMVIEDELLFSNLEQALGITIHPDVSCYFTSFYSDNVTYDCSEGLLELLFAWNKDDFYRLQENIIGHIMMKQKLAQPVTIFFAVTDQEDMIVSVDNSSGEVWVEQVGCLPHKKLADNLAEFLNQLNATTKVINH